MEINNGDKLQFCQQSGLIPRSRRLAASSTFHGMLSEVRFSAPVRYSARTTGHSSSALSRPRAVNVNAIWLTGGSPITLRNITWKCKARHEQGSTQLSWQLGGTYSEHGIAGSCQRGQHNAAQRAALRDAVHVGEQRNAGVAQYDGHNLQ